MFERFTDRARRVIVLAQEEARELNHNFIGTEHILLGLLHEGEGVAARALTRFGITLEGTRDEVRARVGTGTSNVTVHIPFTPRAKKTLQLALREALELNHNYIGTEHILLGVIREGDGVGATILKEHSADLTQVRVAVLDLLHGYQAAKGGHWLRRRVRSLTGSGEGPGPGETGAQHITPAADASLGEAARMAGGQPVGSHHLVLAALSDPNALAAQALGALGVDLDRAREALKGADVTGTSDELPEEAGRRQMLIRVADEKLTIEVTDPAIISLAELAIGALEGQADPPATIRGDLPESASLSALWLTLRDSLVDIRERAVPSGQESKAEDSPKPPESGTETG